MLPHLSHLKFYPASSLRSLRIDLCTNVLVHACRGNKLDHLGKFGINPAFIGRPIYTRVNTCICYLLGRGRSNTSGLFDRNRQHPNLAHFFSRNSPVAVASSAKREIIRGPRLLEVNLVPGLGFEPRLTDPNSAVLPLDDPGMHFYNIRGK